MKSKKILYSLSMAVVLHLGARACSAQTNIYLFSGSETNITLSPGTYIITAYGAAGAYPSNFFAALGGYGGLGAEMSAEFNFSTSTTLTLLVGGGGFSSDPGDPGGGGGGSFVVEGSTPLVIAGGGGGCVRNPNSPGGNGTVSTNGGSSVNSPTHRGYGVGGANGGGGYGGYGVGISGGGGGGGGFLGNGSNGGGELSFGGGGGTSFETGGGGGVGGDNYGGGVDGGYGGYGGGGGGGTSSGGGGGGYSGGGGGYEGYSGGGGGSIIDSSAIAILAEVPGILSPYYLYNGNSYIPEDGEIIIIAVPTPIVITTDAAFGFTNGVFGFNLIGPSGSNVVIQASTDLQTWVPVQTNLLGSGPLQFSDTNAPTNAQRFYRAQLLP
jgi:hypothetical protein